MDKMVLFAELSKTVCESCNGKAMCENREKYASSCRKIHEIAACVEPIINDLEKEAEFAWSMSATNNLTAQNAIARATRYQNALAIANDFLNGKFEIDKEKMPKTTSGALDWQEAFIILAESVEHEKHSVVERRKG